MGLHLLKEEILAAIGEMKNNKAEGIDNILTEIIKNLGETIHGTASKNKNRRIFRTRSDR